ncbi:MAG: HD domain-containing protein [Acidobacteriota bacterium]|jgi:hypothetical protein|nr:HD domain-containing protein [Acidobacteriota bacterium]
MTTVCRKPGWNGAIRKMQFVRPIHLLFQEEIGTRVILQIGGVVVKMSHKIEMEQKIKELVEQITSQPFVADLNNLYREGIHGIGHIYRVLLLVQKLCELEKCPVSQRQILEFCAIFHDIGRTDDGVDDSHGQNSIDILKEKHYFGLAHSLIFVDYVIVNHCKNDRIAYGDVNRYDFENEQIGEALYLLKFFKDCDNLDRFRLGDFDKSYLRLPNSHKLINTAEELNNKIDI